MKVPQPKDLIIILGFIKYHQLPPSTPQLNIQDLINSKVL